MSWRTMVVNQHSKLSYQNNCLIYRSGKDMEKIPISEINTVIIETTDVVVTTSLIFKLVESNIKTIFCDEKRNPSCELSPFYGAHNTSQKIRQQISWDEVVKRQIWTKIVKNKINNQAKLLKKLGKSEADMLFQYSKDVQFGDVTNREGHAAKVYFNALFGKTFHRDSDSEINAFLDYGYTLLLSSFNREIVKNGCFTQLGINHQSYFNQFNLSSDLMEPFRYLVDELTYENRELFFEDSKYRLMDLFTNTYKYDGSEMYLINIIEKYVKTILSSLNSGSTSIKEF